MRLRIASIAATLSLVTACSGPAVKDSLSIQQAALEQAKSIAEQQNPTEVINTTRDLQVEAQKEDLYFYSPSYMEQAEDAMSDAESALKDNKPSHEVIAHALTAQKYFKRGLEIKQTAQTQLQLGFDALAMLRDIKTDTLLRSDYDDLIDDMKDLIILLEQGKNTEALNEQKGFLADVTDVEIKTLKKTHLDPVENAVDKAEDADAEDFAPKSLELAEKAITALEQLIEKSPKQREQIQQDSLASIRLAQHAMHVAKAVQPLLKLNVETAEAHVLSIESLMQRINKALQQDDVTHLSLDSQSIAIAQKAETIYRQAQAIGEKEQWEQEKQQLLKQIAELQPQPAEVSEEASEELAVELPTDIQTADEESTEAEAPEEVAPIQPETPLVEENLQQATDASTSSEPVAEEEQSTQEAPLTNETTDEDVNTSDETPEADPIEAVTPQVEIENSEIEPAAS